MPEIPDTDPNTGNVPFAEGTDVYVKDELGETHVGVITSITAGPAPQYNVLLTCRGEDRELLVAESELMAHATPGWDE